MRQSALILATLLFVVHTAFPGGHQETPDQQAGDLHVMWWGSQTRHERTIEVLELWSAQTGNEISYEFTGWAGYWMKMTTMAAGHHLPDVMQHDYSLLREWQGHDLLKPVDQYVESGVLDFSRIADSALAGGRVDGRLYGVSLGTNSQAIIVDVDMFEDAGIPLPSDYWTWTEFESIAMRIHEALGIWACGPRIYTEQIWRSKYLSAGMRVFAEDGHGLGYEDDSLLVEHLEMCLRLQEAGAIPHISVAASEYGYGQDLEEHPLVEGKAAMASYWSNQLNALWTAAGGVDQRNLRLVMLPRVNRDVSANYIKPSQFFAVTRDSERPELAVDFIDFFTNDVEANRILRGERGVPVADHVRRALREVVPRPSRIAFDFIDKVANDSIPTPLPEPRGFSELVDNVYEPVVRDGVLFGQVAPRDAAQTLRRQAAEIF
jgi:multiple sugar transport system substrate-binding protein